jgi:hypothetical protein
MASINCKNCGNSISKKATSCPKCGEPNPKANHLSVSQSLTLLCFGIGVIWFLAGNQMAGNANNPLQMIENHVTSDSIRQFEIAERQGDKVQICVQAGLVAAAELQAKDESGFTKWKTIEKSVCNQTGLRR